MKAMIFAAGLGSRLKPLTDSMPKALVSVGGKPLLQHTIEKLKLAGFDEIIINIHHFGEQIIDFVESKNYFDIRIEFSDEREKLLDTGGGIKKASHFFDDNRPFLVHNVDILSNIDLNELYTSHVSNNAIATVVCSDRKTSRYLCFDSEKQLKGWINKKTGEVKSPVPDFDSSQYSQLAFSGIHIIDPSIFSHMDNFTDRFSIIDFYLSVCDYEKIVYYSVKDSQMIDVGKHESLMLAEKFLSKS
ncbi:MAG: nucleotidyltransferase family protein [Fermentimonas sp.]|nr:nucleotidyltransferase family protein [Fermentimonas sp.]